jgi:general secretion pathway protein K
MRGFSPKIYAALRPFVCALPNEGLSVLNVNTLRPEDAPLVVMVAVPGLNIEAARRVIEGRPLSGYAAAENFWAAPALAPYRPAEDLPHQTAVTTRYFMLETEVAYFEAEVATQTLVYLDEAGRTSIIGRRLGAFE